MAATAVMPIVARSVRQIKFWRKFSQDALQAFVQQHTNTCFEYCGSPLRGKGSDKDRPVQHALCANPPPPTLSGPSAVVLASNIGYYLPYHAINNRDLMVAYGQMYRCLAFDAAPQSQQLRDSSIFSVYEDLTQHVARRTRDHPVVVFHSGHLRNHTLGFLMHNLIEALPGPSFALSMSRALVNFCPTHGLFLFPPSPTRIARGYEVHITTCSKATDELSAHLAHVLSVNGGGYHILPCSENDGHRVSEALASVVAISPDAIVYNDLSMDGSSYLFAQ